MQKIFLISALGGQKTSKRISKQTNKQTNNSKLIFKLEVGWLAPLIKEYLRNRKQKRSRRN
jgi:hypothetical protein